MRTPSLLALPLLIFLLAVSPRPAPAQDMTAEEAVQQIAGQAALLENLDTIYRLSEELVFWQGVALLGATFDWEFSYNTQNTDPQQWTLRLYNALDESEIEALRASQQITRNRTASEDDRLAGAQLYARHLTMRTTAKEILTSLRDGRDADAARTYETVTLSLRREIANDAFSASSRLRSTIRDTALKVRLSR